VEEWRYLVDYLRWAGKWLSLSMLNTSFLGTPWKNTRAVNLAADQVIVLASRCDNEGKPGWLTTRMVKKMIVGTDGQSRLIERPASAEDPLVVIGEVGGESKIKDYYRPVCAQCFELLTPEQAEVFDSGGYG
jgi:thymidine kinase